MPTVTASDSVELYVEAHGDGFPLLLSPGYCQTHENFRPQVEPFVAAGARVVLWDYRGHGESEAPEDPDAYSREQVQDDMDRVLEWASPGRPAVLGGLSFGGLASLHFAIAHPERVRALLLFDSGPGFKNREAQAGWEAQVGRIADRLEMVEADGSAPPFAVRSFDAVLLDAPCTGTGVLSRRHEARWVRQPDDIVELAASQRVLLDAALDLVAPGGVVVYSTCSLEPEENDEVVDFVLAHREDVEEWPLTDEAPSEFLRDGRLATWPHRHGIDGAFAARLRKLPRKDEAPE